MLPGKGWKDWMEAAPGGVYSGALEEGAWGRVGKTLG